MLSLKNNWTTVLRSPSIPKAALMSVSRLQLRVRNISTVAPAEIETFLQKHKNDKILPVDASWYMPNVPANAYNEFQKERFNKDAVFFDIEKISDHSSPYPHMLPTKKLFEQEVGKLGISNDTSLLLYDRQGIFSLCRAAWMFEIFGHDPEKLFILNTFPSYKQSFSDPNLVMVVHEMINRLETTITTKPSPHKPVSYKATFDPSKVVSYEKILELAQAGEIGKSVTLIDARSNDRFTGAVAEPRAGISSGHVPGAANLPFNELLTPNKSFLSRMTLDSVIKEHNIDESRPIIVMCGTGVTACVVRTGLILAGFNPDNIAVYDGSWTEWAMRAPKSLLAKGDA
ncbi:hypothetical protein HII13_003891 [Brettanomyces bruxellensis]|uniref:Uncharacterized protein n=1 Tax=Dekkera bruxellensis TaxID=5007 RepID=A0A8H6BBI0_DEKBR|nr:hypothetical protein HII13_003891 [Brettanomyces bruxellensis]KAF6016074.1 hypothetical protein HII12_000348 [Brettanomyces bruxellensis]